MKQTPKRLRIEDFDRLVDGLVLGQTDAREIRTGRRLKVVERAAPTVGDELDDLWDNVPI